MARNEKLHDPVQAHTSLVWAAIQKPSVTEDYLAFRVEFVDIEVTGGGQVNLEVCFPDANNAQHTIEDVQNLEVAWWHYPSTVITDDYDFGWLLLSQATADDLEISSASQGKWPSGGAFPMQE